MIEWQGLANYPRGSWEWWLGLGLMELVTVVLVAGLARLIYYALFEFEP